MSKKDDFYIGWQEEMSDSNKQFLKKRLTPFFIGIPILVFLFVFFQKPFNGYQFEFGSISNVTGTYYHTPFPILIANELPNNLSKEILLVGYGKFGAKGTMDAIQKNKGELHGKKITLAGTLIYGDGKTLMELTQEDESLINVNDETARPSPLPTSPQPTTVTGEILDPKCYFGVMKPAIGKIHKSCAIRCISGGIPPVFRQATGNEESSYDYFLLVNENGEPMNQAVLPFVAEEISIQGKVNEVEGWKVLYASVNNFKTSQ